MKQSSHLTRVRAWLAAILIFLGLNLLLLGYPNLIVAQKLPQSRPPATTAQEITRATLKITNRCPQPHYFRVSSDVKDPRFKLQTDAILVAASSTKKIEVLFDAMGLKSSLKAAGECLDCKKEKSCAQDRYQISIEMTAVHSALKSDPPVKPGSISGGPAGVPGPGDGVLSGGLIDVPVPVLGVNYVGIIPSGACPAGSERIFMRMDDQDDHSGQKNTSSVSGWTGNISRYSTGTHFEFCRVNGDQFRPLTDVDYAVLLLSDKCPAGSVRIERLFDNENTDNENWSSGNLGPNTVFEHLAMGPRVDTRMHFCFFRAGFPGMSSFPNLHVPYGVFAAPYSAWVATGIVHTDDEDTQNIDGTSSRDVVGPDYFDLFSKIIYGTEAGTPLKGKNTDLLVAMVAKGDCLNPCPYLGRWDTANCWVGKPPAGRTAIIRSVFGQRFFDWTPPGGAATWYDGTGWDKRKIQYPQMKPFIWSNMWYVEPVCRP